MLPFTFLFALSFPSWLVLPTDASPQTSATPQMVEKTYLSAGSPEQAAQHFEPIFQGAKLPFNPSDDGLGLAVRVAAAECDLLLQFRPAAEGTNVRIFCSPKSRGPQEVLGGARSSGRSSGTGSNYRATWVGREKSTNRDGGSDAPPLVWPSWLRQIGSAESPRPERTSSAQASCLYSSYKVEPQQKRAVITGIRNLIQSHGYAIEKIEFRTGNTIGGAVVQDFYGVTKGVQAGSTITGVFKRGGSTSSPGHVTISYCVDR